MDPDPDPAIFVIDLQDANKKLIFKKKFICFLLFEFTFTSVFQKSQKESQNSRYCAADFSFARLAKGKKSRP